MRNRISPRYWLLLAGALSVAAPLVAEETPADDQAAAPSNQDQQTDRPEYHSRPLPGDVYTPSDKVSEDIPVTFPADI